MRNLQKIQFNLKMTEILYCGYKTFSLLVNAYVRLQRAFGCETLSTDLTGERLFPCKDERHQLAHLNSMHRFNTQVWADLTCVSSQVLLQLSCVHKLVMTLCTFRQQFTF